MRYYFKSFCGVIFVLCKDVYFVVFILRVVGQKWCLTVDRCGNFAKKTTY